MIIKPDNHYVGFQDVCDWCEGSFILAERNQICDGEGNWVLSMCDSCYRGKEDRSHEHHLADTDNMDNDDF